MLAALCVALVAAADVLFYRAPLGWTPALFAALISIALLVRRSACLAGWPGRIVIVDGVAIGELWFQRPDGKAPALRAGPSASSRGWCESPN